jgi:hypothetical protein
MALTETEIASLSDVEARALADFYVRMTRSRRYKADLLAHMVDALHDPRGLGRNAVSRIEDWVREVIRLELQKHRGAR